MNLLQQQVGLRLWKVSIDWSSQGLNISQKKKNLYKISRFFSDSAPPFHAYIPKKSRC